MISMGTFQRYSLFTLVGTVLFCFSARGEGTSEGGARALRFWSSPNGSRVSEADPAKWNAALWTESGLEPAQWDQAIGQWAGGDPATAAWIEAGGKYRASYLSEVQSHADALLANQGGSGVDFVTELNQALIAFAKSQKKLGLGQVPSGLVDPTARREIQSRRPAVRGETPGEAWREPDIARDLRQTTNRVEDREDYPTRAQDLGEAAWVRWKSWARKRVEDNLTELYRRALVTAQSDPASKVKVRVGGRTLGPEALKTISLRWNVAQKRIETADGKEISFKGNRFVVSELEHFIDGKTPLAGKPEKARDYVWTALRQIALAARGLVEMDERIQKARAFQVQSELVPLFAAKTKALRADAGDPLRHSPLMPLVVTPGTSRADLLQQAVWAGYEKSPKYFSNRSGFFRISFRLEQIAKGRWISQRVKDAWKKILISTALLGVGSDQAWQHRKEIMDAAAEQMDWVKEKGFEISLGIPGLGGALQNNNGVSNGEFQLPDPGAPSNNGKVPSVDIVMEIQNRPSSEPIRFIHFSPRGFSSAPKTAYHLPKFSDDDFKHATALKTKLAQKLENGELLIPDLDGFELMAVYLNGKEGAGPGTTILNPDVYHLSRTNEGLYTIEVPKNFGPAVNYEAQYRPVAQQDSNLADLAIRDATSVRALARQLDDAGFSYAAKAFDLEADGMEKSGYAIYPKDVELHLEEGTLYSEARNPWPKKQPPPGNIFSDVTRMGVEGYICTQCAGSAQIASRALRFLYRDRPDVTVRIRTVLPVTGDHGMVPFHAQVEAFTDPTKVKTIVDSTGTRMDPRNQKGPITHPDEDAAAFLDEIRNETQDSQTSQPTQAPKEVVSHLDSQEAASVPVVQSAGLAPVEELLRIWAQADHRFRFRGDISVVEVPKGDRKGPPSGSLLEGVEALESARVVLASHPDFQALPMAIALTVPALPVSALVRDYLFGTISKEELLEKVSRFVPGGANAPKDLAGMLRVISAQQHLVFERIKKMAKTGELKKQYAKLGNLEMTGKILDTLDVMAHYDWETLKASTPKAEVIAQRAFRQTHQRVKQDLLHRLMEALPKESRLSCLLSFRRL